MLDGVSGFNNLTLNGPGVGGDFDGDGKTDLVYASSDSNALIAISYINGDFKLNGFTGLGSTALDLAAVDVNGDGKPDIVTAAGPTAIVALNNTPFAPRVSGALNAASFAGKALASGSLASAFGLGFATGTTIASKIPLPMSLADVTMTVGGVAAPLLFVSPTQMNFKCPGCFHQGPRICRSLWE